MIDQYILCYFMMCFEILHVLFQMIYLIGILISLMSEKLPG